MVKTIDMGKKTISAPSGAGPHDPAVDQKPQQRLVFRVCAVLGDIYTGG
jgi:hypothetical protein